MTDETTGRRFWLRRRSPHNTDIGVQVIALRARCANDALNAFGTSYIFRLRGRRLKRKVQWITYIGFVVPMIVGLLVLGYGHVKSLPVIIGIAVGIGILQAVVSLWAIIGGWVDGASYAATSAPANDLIATKFRGLAESPPEDFRDFQHQYELVKTEDKARREQDFQQGLKDAEMRMGMRAALRQYQRACAGCGETPTDMKATGCGVCGDFHRFWKS